jgi:hypothetical protein
MKASSLDLLEKTLLPPAQARAILQAMEAEFTERDSALATKQDLGGVEHRLELKIERMRSDLKSDIHAATRWNFVFWVTQLAAIAGLLKFVR